MSVAPSPLTAGLTPTTLAPTVPAPVPDDTPAPSSLTLDPLTPKLLAGIVRRVAARPELWRPRLRFTSPERYYVRLESTDAYEVWLLSWLPGQGTGIHGHGGSAGAFTVVRGELTERVFPPTSRPVRPPRVTMATGTARGFGPRHVHEVDNAGDLPAASIHAYSPALTSMAYYRHLPDGRLVAERVEGVDR